MSPIAAEHDPLRPLTEGERWTSRELAALRQHGYRPGAWVRFLRNSLRRSGETRRAHPALAYQTERWGALGAVAWLATCRLGRGRLESAPSLAGGLLWWALVWQMLDWHLGMAESEDGTPCQRLARADAVTLSRYWMVPLLQALTRAPRGLSAVTLLGGVSDWLDGALARRDGGTRLGRDLDTFADLFFLLSATVAARRAQRLSAIGAAAVGARYGAGLAVGLHTMFTRARRPALRARPAGALLRFGGLALAAAGHERTGTSLLVTGCLMPPPAHHASTPLVQLGRAPGQLDR